MRLAALVCSLVALASVAAGQDLGVKAAPQSRPVAVVGGTVHPVSGPPIEKGIVLFAKGLIVVVGDSRLQLPEGVEVVDVTGKHVYPGFVAPHTNLGLTEIGSVRATRDSEEVGGVSPEVRAAVAVNPDSTLIPVARRGGVLTAGIFPSGGVVCGQGTVMRLDGWTWEDMALRVSAGLSVNWPASRPAYEWWSERSEEEQEKEIERARRWLREAFERARAYADAREAGAAGPRDIRFEAMRRVMPAGGEAPELPVFVRANEVSQIRSAVRFAARYGLRLVIVGGRDADRCAPLLREHDVGVIVGSVFWVPRRADSPVDESYGLPARLEKAGVRWCLASGAGAANERNLPFAAAMAVRHGLARDAAIRSITLSAAEMLGVGDELGSLVPGKRATLIVTDGDPLQITSHVTAAWIDGRRVDLGTKQTALRDKYREKYRRLGLIR